MERYVPTLGCDHQTLKFQTNYGEITFEVWDTAGQERYVGIKEGYLIGSHAVVGFFDLTDQSSVLELADWYQSTVRFAPTAKTLACGTKSDLPSTVTPKQKQDTKSMWGEYLEVSVKDNLDTENVFQVLARMVTNLPDLKFIPNVQCYQ